MAVEQQQPVEAEHSGGPFGRLRAAMKRITPGEWALIGIGVIGIVGYIWWYRRQQASTLGPTNPNYQTAQTGDPNSQYQGELAQLLYMLENGSWQTPTTSPQSQGGGGGGGNGGGGGGSGGGGSGGGSGGGAGGGSTSTGGGTTQLLGSPASSGSGITQQPNNASPITNATQAIQGPSSVAQINQFGLPANTGTVGVPISQVSNSASAVRVPVNVTANLSPAGGQQTVGSIAGPTVHHVNAVQSYTATHTNAPRYSPPPPPRTTHAGRTMR